MAKHRKVHIEPCAYCGVTEKLTMDHVIPRCLFPDGKAPTDTPVVWACTKCNGAEKNLDDSTLRDLLVTDAATSRDPIAQQIFNGPFLRAARSKDGRIQSPLAYMVQTREPQRLSVMSKGGIFLEELFTFDIKERLERIFLKIVHGLHLAYTDEPLPTDVSCEVYRLFDVDDAREKTHLLLAYGGTFHKIGDGKVFQCLYAVDPTRPDMSLWLMVFYRRVIFLVPAYDHTLENTTTAPAQ